ncbi:endonuclease domain-containing protein [Microbacterium sp.]|uniref:endonuclease domain-containing protein n=1 Tax=Microbacterium sp. TaxID=51671 RepID=UPI003C78F930
MSSLTVVSAIPPAIVALLAAVDAVAGVARVHALVAGGHSRYWIARSLEAGYLVRVRRDWVALPTADPELRAAARWGVVLSCITQARRLGLWVFEEDRCHVAAAPTSSSRKPDLATVHWAKPAVPRPPGSLIDSLENVLALVAVCQSFERALVVWESALQKGLTDAAALRQLALPASARAILDAATPYSDSGLETLFRTRLSWLRLPLRAQIWLYGHRVDLLIGDRLVIQLDGGHHVGSQRSSDNAHDAALLARGYYVLHFTYGQVVNDWPAVQDAVMRAIAAGLHLAR